MERQFAFSKFIIVKDKTLMLNLHQTEMVRVIIQDEERHVPEVDKNTSFNVPEIRIDNTEDLQDEWEMEMEDCEDLEYAFYEHEVSHLWLRKINYQFP